MMTTMKLYKQDPLQLIGSRVNGYRIFDYLTTGGTAHIYKCRHNDLPDTQMVIKILRAGLRKEPDAKRRMHKEIYVHKQLTHPHILEYYDDGRIGGLPYVVLAHAPLGNLYDYLNAYPRTLTLGRIATFITQLADALHYIHEKDIIHRDVKPSNILVQDDDNVLLTDFGIVRTADLNLRYSFQPGTLNFMAPEQLDSLDADFTTDQFGLGVVAYWLLTGEKPFLAKDRTEAKTKRVQGARPVHEIDERLPQTIQPILDRAMHPKMDLRYTFIEEFAYTLAQVIEDAGVSDMLSHIGLKQAEPAHKIFAASTSPVLAGFTSTSAYGNGNENEDDTSDDDANIITYPQRPNTTTRRLSRLRMLAVLVVVMIVGLLTVRLTQPNTTQVFDARDPNLILDDLQTFSASLEAFSCLDFITAYNELAVQVNLDNPDFLTYAPLTHQDAATRTIAEDICVTNSDNLSPALWQQMRNELNTATE